MLRGFFMFTVAVILLLSVCILLGLGCFSMWHDLAVALCLVLVFEGILPFLSPSSWRNMIRQAGLLSDSQLRIMGMISMVLGVALLYGLN